MFIGLERLTRSKRENGNGSTNPNLNSPGLSKKARQTRLPLAAKIVPSSTPIFIDSGISSAESDILSSARESSNKQRRERH